MSDFLVPSHDEFVWAVAKSIAYTRLRRAADEEIKMLIGLDIDSNPALQDTFEAVFKLMWDSVALEDLAEKDKFFADAQAAISAINLKLLTTSD